MIPIPLFMSSSTLKWAGIGLIALAVAGVYVAQRIALENMESDLRASQNEARQCAVDLGVQTVQVNAWQKAAESRAEQAQAAIEQAARYRAQARQAAESLYTLQLPDEECDALRLLVDTARPGPVSLRPTGAAP